MKKLRIFLSAMALMLAVTATFAVQFRAPLTVNGWEYIPGAGEPDQCISQTNLDCNTTSANLCTINGHKAGNSSSTSTSCGTQYKRP
jgi:hypothetical protein